MSELGPSSANMPDDRAEEIEAARDGFPQWYYTEDFPMGIQEGAEHIFAQISSCNMHRPYLDIDPALWQQSSNAADPWSSSSDQLCTPSFSQDGRPFPPPDGTAFGLTSSHHITYPPPPPIHDLPFSSAIYPPPALPPSPPPSSPDPEGPPHHLATIPPNHQRSPPRISEISISTRDIINVRGDFFRCETVGNGKVCGKIFGRVTELIRHRESVHTKERGKTCPFCVISRRFSRLDTLKRHIKRTHPGCVL